MNYRYMYEYEWIIQTILNAKMYVDAYTDDIAI